MAQKLAQPPAAVVGVVVGATNLLGNLQNALLPGQAVLLNYSAGCLLISRSLYVAATLEIADRLRRGPRPVAELAAEAAVNEHALFRILRALSSVGVFKEKPARTFSNNSASKYLCSDVEDNLLTWVKYVGADWHHRQWADILGCVSNGNDVYRNLYGKEFYSWFAENPDESKVFDAGMIGLSAISDKPIAAAYPFGKYGSILDIAGGIGGQLGTILGAYPGLKGGLLELGPVIRQAREEYDHLKPHLDRVEFVSADFFESVPGGFDIYLLKSIIHNWTDDRALRILKNVQVAMKPESKVLLGELVVNGPNKQHFSKLLDIAMLTLTGGVERTREEYAALLRELACAYLESFPQLRRTASLRPSSSSRR